MYTPDRDIVVPEPGIPAPSSGAPLPVLLADEHAAVVAYYGNNVDPTWDGTTVRMVDVENADEPIAIVRFDRCYATLFGPPNDEAFSGHPLASRGLTPYAMFHVRFSSWVAAVERMNEVHPHHSSRPFREMTHYVLAFHDSTFECIARGYRVSRTRGSVVGALPLMKQALTAAG